MNTRIIFSNNTNVPIKVDEEDYDELSKYKWTTIKGHTTFYAVRFQYSRDKKSRKLIYMHRVVMGLKAGTGKQDNVINHINRNGLDNRKANLEIVTNADNNVSARFTRFLKINIEKYNINKPAELYLDFGL